MTNTCSNARTVHNWRLNTDVDHAVGGQNSHSHTQTHEDTKIINGVKYQTSTLSQTTKEDSAIKNLHLFCF